MDDEADLARAKRVLLVFRLTFYPLALAALVFLLAGRSATGEPPAQPAAFRTSLRVIDGTTAAGHRLRVVFDGRGIPRKWYVEVHGTCENGATHAIYWDGAQAATVQRGRRTLGREAIHRPHPNGVTQHLDQRFEAERSDGRLRGTARFSAWWDGLPAGTRCRGATGFDIPLPNVRG